MGNVTRTPAQKMHASAVGSQEATSARSSIAAARKRTDGLPVGGERQRVLWAGVSETHEVSQLATHVRRCLERRGISIEARKYAPHVTLARLRDTPLEPVIRFVDSFATWRGDPFSVTDFQLFSSRLGRAGSQHRVEASYPLIPARPS